MSDLVVCVFRCANSALSTIDSELMRISIVKSLLFGSALLLQITDSDLQNCYTIVNNGIMDSDLNIRIIIRFFFSIFLIKKLFLLGKFEYLVDSNIRQVMLSKLNSDRIVILIMG